MDEQHSEESAADGKQERSTQKIRWNINVNRSTAQLDQNQKLISALKKLEANLKVEKSIRKKKNKEQKLTK